ncbi:MAG: MmgE/PrpD family protein [Burkholderiales bacterium]|nr:MAG: MmgE/PrpD family protein [Burkholderiales bacterium]
MAARVPPLAHRLVGRPDIADPAPNYARLCIPFVAATTLIDGTCEPDAFGAERLRDAGVHALAARVSVELDDNPDVNALWPQHFAIELADGRRWQRTIETPIGHPDNPLSRERHLAKFRTCWQLGGMTAERGERLIEMIDGLESQPDVRALAALLVRS